MNDAALSRNEWSRGAAVIARQYESRLARWLGLPKISAMTNHEVTVWARVARDTAAKAEEEWAYAAACMLAAFMPD